MNSHKFWVQIQLYVEFVKKAPSRHNFLWKNTSKEPSMDSLSSIMENFNQKIQEICKKAEGKELSTETYVSFVDSLKSEMCILGREMILRYIIPYDCTEKVVFYAGDKYYRKINSPKTFGTYFGDVKIPRNIFQTNEDGKCFIPLDDKWGVTDSFLDPLVQESSLFAASLMTPDEAAQLFGKCSLFKYSTTALQHEIQNAGRVIEVNSSGLISDVATSYDIPEATKVIAASLDGTNVMLREAGTRMGYSVEKNLCNPGLCQTGNVNKIIHLFIYK